LPRPDCALGGLEGFPVADLLLGCLVPAFGAEDMRVPADHLVGDAADHGVEIERAFLFGHPGVVDDLEQQIPQLVGQVGRAAPGDGVGDLVGLLDGIGGDRVESLHDVPGAAGLGIAQTAHDRDQSVDAAVGIVDQQVGFGGGRRVGHGRQPSRPGVGGKDRSRG
jgi:hypothetical protein